MVLIFIYILVLYNHIKTHTLMFCRNLTMRDLNKLVYSLIHLSFSFLLSRHFLKTILLKDNLFLTPNNSFFLSIITSLICLCFLTFCIIFAKTELFTGSKNHFLFSYINLHLCQYILLTNFLE